MDQLGMKESHKPHRERHAGRKSSKKKEKNGISNDQNPRQRNPKAFAIQSAVKAERRFRRTMDIKNKRQQLPTVDRTPVEPPPIVVAIVGPPMVGKSTLLKCLIKHFTRQNLANIQGPVTVVSSKKRRLTFIECINDINVMIDVAKVADLVLLLIDAKFGFEMETFEFLNICQVHGFPRILGVLTHLDLFKNNKQQRVTKKQLKHRFWTEIYQGAKLFYLSGMLHDEYLNTEIKNLGRFISVMKFRSLLWRDTHPYLVADRMEDVTDPERIRQNANCNRNVCFYGFSRGTHLKPGSSIHIPGAGDFSIADIALLSDPCPLPDKEKRRSLNEKERLIYAPMSGVGGVVYDKDAVYIELGGSHSHYTSTTFSEGQELEPNSELVSSIIGTQHTMNTKIDASQVQLFSSTNPLSSREVNEEAQSNVSEMPSEERVTDENGRVRRRVTFNSADNSSEYNDGSDTDESDGNENEESSDEESDQVDEQFDSDEDGESTFEPSRKKLCSVDAKVNSAYGDQEIGELRWKHNLIQKAADNFYKHQEITSNLQKMVYGKVVETSHDADTEQYVDGLFRYAKKKDQDQQKTRITMNQVETSKFVVESVQDWTAEEVKEKIRDCFVTGKWKESEDAEALLRHNDASDDEMFGDFEDLESGEVYDSTKPGEKHLDEISDSDAGNTEPTELDKTTAEKRREKKRKLKETFDTEYDEKDGGTSYYDELKAEMDQQTQLNKSEFEDLDDDLRVQYEGFRPGMYVRIEVANVPCELVTNFDASYPLVLGVLAAAEDNIGFVQVRLKKHRWYPKILKTRDPLIISLGWRRFQTVVLFSMQDHNGRNRLLKYTPEHLHCMASFWGPITPQNTGFVAIQTVSESTPNFRIAATGVVLDLDKSTQIAKKLKLTGIPSKIYKKTAFVKGMFNTSLEVGKYEGASIRTVSGIRGQIKKALSNPEGSFRATFEDKILMSDIVFLRTWFVVEVPRFYNPVTSLLLPAEKKAKWLGMRTVGQLRKEKGIKLPTNTDSFYRPITRQPRVFNPLSVPRALQRELPYKDKPKFAPSKPIRALEKQRIAVVREPYEQKVSRLMKQVRVLYGHRQTKEKELMAKRVDAHRAEQAKTEIKRLRRQKEVKKDICRVLNKLEQKKQRQQGNPKQSRYNS